MSQITRFTKWCRRRPVVAAVAAAAALSLAALISVSLWYNARLSELLTISENERQTAREQEWKARERAYVADMHNAGIAFDQADLNQTLKLLNRYLPQDGEPDLRKFAWWYLWRECHESSRILGTHQGYASAVAITRNGDLAASGGSDSLIKLWALPSGEQVGELIGHEHDDVTSLDFSPTGDRLVSTGLDGTVRVWDVPAQRQLFVRRDHGNKVSRARYSPTGDLIASGGNDHSVRLWDPQTGESLGVLAGHSGNLRDLAFHPTEPLLASCSRDGSIRFWDLQRLEPDERIAGGMIDVVGPDPSVRAIAFEPNGKSLLAGTSELRVLRFSWEPERRGEKLSDDQVLRSPYSIAWPPDGFPIVALGNSEILIADPVGPKWARQRLRGHRDVVVAVAAPSDARSLVSVSRDGTIRYWPNYQTRSRINVAQATGEPWVERIRSFYPLQWCGSRLAADFVRNELAIYQMPERKVLQRVRKTNDDRFALSPDGQFLLLCQPDGQAICLRVADGQALWSRMFPPTTRQSNEYRPFQIDASTIYAVGSCGIELLVIRLTDGEILHRLAHPGLVNQTILLERPGEPLTAISTSYDGLLRFWDVTAGKLRRELPVTSSGIDSIALSADRELIAVGGAERKIRIYRVSDLTEVSILPFEERPAQFDFLADGQTLVVVSRHRISSRYNIASLPEMLNNSLVGLQHETEVLNVSVDDAHHGLFAVSPDGQQIAIARDGWIDLLDGRPGR